MRILLLNQFYPPDMAPTGQILHDIARVLVHRGHEVHVICSQRSYDGGQSYPKREQLDGIRVHRVPALGFGRRGFAGKLADYASYFGLLAVELFVNLPRPDLILALTTPPYVGLLAKAAALLKRSHHAHWIMDLYPDVIEAHGVIRSAGIMGRFLHAMTRLELAGATQVVSLGSFMARKVERYVGRSTPHAWVPLWGNDSLAPQPKGALNSLRAHRGWNPDELVLMYSGNMGLGHRFTEFLGAAARLGRKGPQWAYVGGGKRAGEIEAFARSHPEARIEILPYVQAQQLQENLVSADVHLVSLDSSWQGLMVPSKLQGIFAVGRPVIFVGGRDNEIASWVSESGAGWLVAEGDIDGVLRAVEAARDPAERARRGAAAARYAAETFDREQNCERIAVLLEASTPPGCR